MVDVPGEAPSVAALRAAAPAAIERAARRMLEPDLGEFEGLPALRRFVAEVGSWPEATGDWNWSARFNYQVIERRGTGGGNFRTLYSRFLAEVGRTEEATLAADAAAAWTALAGSAVRGQRERRARSRRLGADRRSGRHRPRGRGAPLEPAQRPEPLGKYLQHLRGDRFLATHRAVRVTAHEVTRPAEGDVALVVLVAPPGVEVVAAVGLDDEAGRGPEEVDLVAEQRNADRGHRQSVVAADPQQQLLQPGARLRQGQRPVGESSRIVPAPLRLGDAARSWARRGRISRCSFSPARRRAGSAAGGGSSPDPRPFGSGWWSGSAGGSSCRGDQVNGGGA